MKHGLTLLNDGVVARKVLALCNLKTSHLNGAVPRSGMISVVCKEICESFMTAVIVDASMLIFTFRDNSSLCDSTDGFSHNIADIMHVLPACTVIDNV